MDMRICPKCGYVLREEGQGANHEPTAEELLELVLANCQVFSSELVEDKNTGLFVKKRIRTRSDLVRMWKEEKK